MLEIFLYAFGVYYTPGPANLVGLNAGLNGQFRQSVGYFSGVGAALLGWFLVIGYTGQAVISLDYLPYIALAGCAYILFLAVKILKAHVVLDAPTEAKAVLTFRDGLFLQLLNPKGMLVIIPITGVLYPAAGVTGVKIFVFSIALSILGMCAPGSYSFVGSVIGKRITRSIYFDIFNKLMAVMLISVSVSLFYEHVWPAFLTP